MVIINKTKKFYDFDKREKSSKIYYGERRNLIEELEKTKERLINDVGIYFDAINQTYQSEAKKVGFFGSIRLLVPVIEHLTFLLYQSRNAIFRDKVLLELGLKYPEITWQIFRHPLIHGDEMGVINMGNQTIRWGIAMNNEPHFYKVTLGDIKSPTTSIIIDPPIDIVLDTLYLYNSLVIYISDKIKNSSPEQTTYIIIDTRLFQSKTHKKKNGKRSIPRKQNTAIKKEIRMFKRTYEKIIENQGNVS